MLRIRVHESGHLLSIREMSICSIAADNPVPAVQLKADAHDDQQKKAGLHGKQEGKQDCDKKLQADPWNFPKWIFTTKGSQMI